VEQRPRKEFDLENNGGGQWQEVHDYLKSLCGDVHITRGEYDDDSRYPETKQLTIGAFKLGICHGHQVSLYQFAGSCYFSILQMLDEQWNDQAPAHSVG
jgi:hypothetical protein